MTPAWPKTEPLSMYFADYWADITNNSTFLRKLPKYMANFAVFHRLYGSWLWMQNVTTEPLMLNMRTTQKLQEMSGIMDQMDPNLSDSKTARADCYYCKVLHEHLFNLSVSLSREPSGLVLMMCLDDYMHHVCNQIEHISCIYIYIYKLTTV